MKKHCDHVYQSAIQESAYLVMSLFTKNKNLWTAAPTSAEWAQPGRCSTPASTAEVGDPVREGNRVHPYKLCSLTRGHNYLATSQRLLSPRLLNMINWQHPTQEGRVGYASALAHPIRQSSLFNSRATCQHSTHAHPSWVSLRHKTRSCFPETCLTLKMFSVYGGN